MSPEAASQLTQKSNYQTMLDAGRGSARSSGFSAASSSAAAVLPEKKNVSHKAAEQKRRDSLKAGFDDLRLLLPPIIIDPDSDEPLLPGSAPPRGPQRNLPPGSEDHPNRGVSKLALLKCSNEFIGRLNKRIERRDNEIEILREELRWMREKTGLGDGDEREWADLDRDLDEIEREESKVTGVGVALLDSPVGDETGKRSKFPKPSPLSRSVKNRDADIDTVDEEDD